MANDEVQSLLGGLFAVAAVAGYFIYSDATRPNIQMRHMVYDFHVGGENTDKYANAFVRFYMNQGLSIEQMDRASDEFISAIGDQSKIDDADALKNYFYCAISLKTGEKIKARGETTQQNSEAYEKALDYMATHKGEKPTGKFRIAFEKATGIGYSTFMSLRSGKDAPLLSLFQDCWKESQSKNLIASLPYGINLP